MNMLMSSIKLFILVLIICLSPQGISESFLSPGDKIYLSALGADEVSGLYYIDSDGHINVPYYGAFNIAYKKTQDAEAFISQELVNKGFFDANKLFISINIVEMAKILVSVEGEVYTPGLQRLDDKEKSSDKLTISNTITNGTNQENRYFSQAIRAAGGLTAYADIKNIKLVRSGQEEVLDLSPFVIGGEVQEKILVQGDRIIVPKLTEPNPLLVRPSRLTPPGIKIFISNIASPGTPSPETSMPLPYGSRLTQALAILGCSGGNNLTNSSRYVSLVRTNKVTGTSMIFKHKIKDIINTDEKNANDINPYLLEADSVSCHDSNFTSFRDIFKGMAEFLMPFVLWKAL